MKNKILGIIVCMLLIAATVLPVAGTMNNENIISIPEVEYDGCLEQTRGGSWIEDMKLLASDGYTADSFGRSVSIYGDTALIGTPDDDDNGVNSGAAYVFKRTGTTWTEEAELLASDGEGGDYFGTSVSVYGDTALIGAFKDDDKGSAYVFKRTGTTWTQETKLLAGTEGDNFGISVSIDGDTILIGARYDDDNGYSAGAAYVFKRTGTTWTQETKLLASDGEGGDYFGHSVSIDEDTALIAAPGDDDNGYSAGAAYVFKRTGTTWTQEAKLLALDGAANDIFGESVSLVGDLALIGAPYDDDNGEKTGAAYVFKRTGTTWTQEAKLLASDGEGGDIFGQSVSIDEDTALVGAPGDNYNGSAYIFKRTGTTWIQEAKLLASDGEWGDIFGQSVSIDEDMALIGAPGDDETWVNCGSAYIFKRESECCLVIENVSGGLLDSSGSLKVGAVIRNNGKGVCEDVNWSFNFSGGIVMIGQNKGLESTIPAGGTVTVYSKIVIGFSIPVLFPAFVTVTADAANNNCPPATMEKHVFLLFILLSVY